MQNLVKKGPEFDHYLPTVIERSKSITMQHLSVSNSFLRLVFEHYKILISPPSLTFSLDVTNFKFGQEGAVIDTSRTNGDKRIKITIYRIFQVNILTSKYRFHKFWSCNPISDAIIAKVVSKKAQICISRAKFDRRIKMILKWNQTDASNAICGRKIKTRSTRTFRGNVFVKAIFWKF